MFGVASEGGRLRQGILPRPGLELKRLTPDNAADLLFDDVLWVSRAQAEHDAFAAVLRERGVTVHYYSDLLAQTLEIPAAREYILDRVFDPRWHGPLAAGTLRAAMDGLDSARLAELLAGEIDQLQISGGGPGPPGGVPGGRDHQALDRRPRPEAQQHRVPLPGPRRLRARPAAEPPLPA